MTAAATAALEARRASAVDAAKVALAGAGGPAVRAYRRRWLMLALYLLLLLFNAVPWMQYTVLADVVTKYYGVDNGMVEWTALVYNTTSIILVLPGAWFLDKYGLRPSMVVGAVGTALGLWFRVLGCWPQHFWAVLAGHAIVSVSTNFLASSPPRLAAVWFPANEVSTAVGASIVGSMGGVSIGCLVAPLTARAVWTPEENFKGFLGLNVSLAALATVLMVAVLFWYEQSPPLPPSVAQAAAAASAPSGNYLQSVRGICRDGAFLLLLLSYNLIGGVFVAVTTVLNRDIMEFFPDRAAETGFIATLLCLTGMVATFVLGILLDKTKMFKELSNICFFGGVVCITLYSVTIATASMEVLYVVAAFIGIFMTSYFVPAYEWAVEITYPEPEGNPTSLLHWVLQPVSLVGTLVYSRVFSVWGAHAAHGMLVAMMAVGFLVQLAIPKRYRRREAELALAKAAAEKPLLLEEGKQLQQLKA